MEFRWSESHNCRFHIQNQFHGLSRLSGMRLEEQIMMRVEVSLENISCSASKILDDATLFFYFLIEYNRGGLTKFH
jgi:hypothetical protein